MADDRHFDKSLYRHSDKYPIVMKFNFVCETGLYCNGGGTENAGLENAGLENVGPNRRGGKRRTGKHWNIICMGNKM